MDASLPSGFSLRCPFDRSDFPDERLWRRARTCVQTSVLSHLGAASHSNEALRKGKDRFCHNRRVGADALLFASARSLPEDLVTAPILLSVEDTMLVRAGGRFEPADAGPLRNSYDHGYVVHDGFVLRPGASFPEAWMGALVWTRSFELHLKDHKQRSAAERESAKWALFRQQTRDGLRRQGFRGRVVSLNDREGDNWPSLVVARQRGHELVSRACQDRHLAHEELTLKAFLRQQPAIAQVTMPLYGRGKHRHRKGCIEVQVRWSEVTLLPPKNADPEHDKPLTLVAIHLSEVGRRGKKRFESFVLTTCRVETDEEALEVVGWYGYRWASEVGHDVLKNGLGLEKEPVADVEAFKRLLALEGPVAAQVARWVSLARQPKPMAVSKVFDRATLEGLRDACQFYKEKAPSRWTLVGVVETLARLGGADVRPNRLPGWRVVLRGWQRFEQFRQIAEFARTGKAPARQAQATRCAETDEDEDTWEPPQPMTILWKRPR